MLHDITVRDYMTTNLTTFTPDSDLMSAIAKLIELRISGAPVVDNMGNIVGMLSEKDCMRVALNAGYHEELAGDIKDYMCKDVITVDAEASIVEVAKMFLDSSFKRYPVVEDNELLGQISRSDVLRAIQAIRD